VGKLMEISHFFVRCERLKAFDLFREQKRKLHACHHNLKSVSSREKHKTKQTRWMNVASTTEIVRLGARRQNIHIVHVKMLIVLIVLEYYMYKSTIMYSVFFGHIDTLDNGTEAIKIKSKHMTNSKRGKRTRRYHVPCNNTIIIPIAIIVRP
jgi:hypothetical protein